MFASLLSSPWPYDVDRGVFLLHFQEDAPARHFHQAEIQEHNVNMIL